MWQSFFRADRRTIANIPATKTDLSELERSSSLLRQTATDVAEEALKTSKSIEEQAQRINACFSALNEASDMITILDASRRIYFCNTQFAKIFGNGDYHSIISKRLCEVVPHINRCVELWQTVAGNNVWLDEYMTNYKITVIPMMNGKPYPVYYICTIKH